MKCAQLTYIAQNHVITHKLHLKSFQKSVLKLLSTQTV